MAMLLTRIQRITSRHAEFSNERIRKVSRSSGTPCSVLRCRCVSPALAETRELLVRPISARVALHAWTRTEMAGEAWPGRASDTAMRQCRSRRRRRREERDVQQLCGIPRRRAPWFGPDAFTRQGSQQLPLAGPGGLRAAAHLLLAANQGEGSARMPLATRIRWRDRRRLISSAKPTSSVAADVVSFSVLSARTVPATRRTGIATDAV